jgi:hypothetical protein
MRDLLLYHTNTGSMTRRGGYVPPDPPEIYIKDFENLTVQNPITLTNLRDALAYPGLGDFTNRNKIQVVDLGGGDGKSLRITLPTGIGGANGIALANLPLSRQPDDFIVQKQRIRFAAGFDVAKGGKCGWGIGGWTTTTAPVANYTSPTYPVSGGNTSPYSFSVRCEWREALSAGGSGKIHEICYLPTRANYNPAVEVFGIGRTLNYTPPPLGTFIDYERRILLNTATETDTTVDPRTLVKGTLDVNGNPNGDGDYYADGIHQVFINNVKVYEKLDEVWRFYAQNKWAGMFSVFRGGGDNTWLGTVDGSQFDFASHSLLEEVV